MKEKKIAEKKAENDSDLSQDDDGNKQLSNIDRVEGYIIDIKEK